MHVTQRWASASPASRPSASRRGERPHKTTARGFKPLRAEPNGFRVHLLNRSDTLSLPCSECDGQPSRVQGTTHQNPRGDHLFWLILAVGLFWPGLFGLSSAPAGLFGLIFAWLSWAYLGQLWLIWGCGLFGRILAVASLADLGLLQLRLAYLGLACLGLF